MGVDDRLSRVLAGPSQPFSEPTEIQRHAFSALSRRKGCTGVALLSETGSGKTLAYLLPILASICQRHKAVSPCIQAPSVLILTSNRELVLQIAREAQRMQVLLKEAGLLPRDTAIPILTHYAQKQRDSTCHPGESLETLLCNLSIAYSIIKKKIKTRAQDAAQESWEQALELQGVLKSGDGPGRYPPVVISTPGALFSAMAPAAKGPGAPVRAPRPSSDLTRLFSSNLETIVVDEADMLMADGCFEQLPLFFIHLLRRPGTVKGAKIEGEQLEALGMLGAEARAGPALPKALPPLNWIFAGATLPEKSIAMAWIKRYLPECLFLRSSQFHALGRGLIENQAFLPVSPLQVPPPEASPLDTWSPTAASSPSFDEATFKRLARERAASEALYEDRLFDFKVFLLRDRVLKGLQKDRAEETALGHVLVFANSAERAERLLAALKEPPGTSLAAYFDGPRALPREEHMRTYQIACLHRGLPGAQRDLLLSVSDDRSAAAPMLLVCTDYASRGLDIPGVSHIVNFDFPTNASEYIHRAGRAGRMGRSGSIVSFHVIGRDDMLVDAVKRSFSSPGSGSSPEDAFSRKRSLRSRVRRAEQ